MNSNELNNEIRNMCSQCISDGSSKRNVCTVILDAGLQSQFQGFLDGNNLGLKPLTKIIDKFKDYELRLIVVNKNDSETISAINGINKDFIEKGKVKLVKALENIDQIKKSSAYNNPIVTEATDLIAKILLNE